MGNDNETVHVHEDAVEDDQHVDEGENTNVENTEMLVNM